MKRILALTLALGIIFNSGCGREKSLRDTFCDYYVDELDDGNITIGDYSIYVVSLGKEDTTYQPKVVLSAYIEGHEQYEKTYSFAHLSVSEQKEILRKLGDKVIRFAKNQNWKNDYHLYVTLGTSYHYVYDYELNWLYVPNCIDVYLKMYEEFKTFSRFDVEKMDGGREFLIESGLFYDKHGELEYNSFFDEGFDVYIDREGEFHSYGKDGSTLYLDSEG